MDSPEDLKKQLEELIHFNIEQDLLDYPHSKAAFAPYVVTAFVNGVTPQEIPQDVLKQLDKEIEDIRQMSAVIAAVKVKKGFKEWIKALLSKF